MLFQASLTQYYIVMVKRYIWVCHNRLGKKKLINFLANPIFVRLIHFYPIEL